MSDGPHRSLQMRKGWKKLAEKADNSAYAFEEVRDQLRVAVLKDWEIEACDRALQSVWDIVEDGQRLLFSSHAARLEEAKYQIADSPMAQLLVECIINRSNGDDTTTDAVESGIQDTLAIWESRHAREMEEHYYRESDRERASHLRARLDSAGSVADLSGFAREILDRGAAATASPPAKQTGLDDGVKLGLARP